jgi:hypothetical protein
VEIEMGPGYDIISMHGKFKGGSSSQKSNTFIIGPILAGQSRSISLVIKPDTSGTDEPILVATYGHASLPLQAVETGSPVEATAQSFRLRIAEVIALQMSEDSPYADPKHVVDFIREIKASPAAADPRIVALLADLEGQVTEALSKSEWYTKWGKHYLPSLTRSHTLQQCSNFKVREN